jgi:DNA polymerase-3 subunit delta'
MPELLDAVPASLGTKQTVARLASPDSSPTGVMLYGPRGSGVDELASFLCQSWLCKVNDGKPCGVCGACVAYANSRCVDFQRIEPFGAGRLIRVGAIRFDSLEKDFTGVPLIDFFRTRPLMAARKVVWLTEVERLNSRASNALLKTLEELPATCRIMMTTNDLTKVIPTIRSRCVLVGCGVDQPDTQDEIVRRFATTPGEAATVERHREVFCRLDALLSEAVSAPPMQALRLAERFRLCVDMYGKDSKGPQRENAAPIIEAASRWFVVVHPELPHWAQGAAQAHKRVLGNVSPTYAIDCWFLTGTLKAQEQDTR